MISTYYFFRIFVCIFFIVFTSPIYAAPLKLPSLPKTCLPEEGRMFRDIKEECHCPPQSMCTENVIFSGKKNLKLPDHIQEICCPPPPPPPLPPVIVPPSSITPPPISGNSPGTPNAKNNECDVHYFTHRNTACADRTTFGPRTARFCSTYATTSSAYTAIVNILNSCLSGCSDEHNALLNYGGPYLRGSESDKNREYSEEVGHDLATAYGKCRYECFNRNGALNLQSDAEKNLIEWIRNRYRAPIGKSAFENEAKMLHEQQLVTANQSNFGNFWFSTIPNTQAGYGFQNRMTVSRTETQLGVSGYAEQRIDPNQRSFFRQVFNKGFGDLSRFLSMSSSAPGMQLIPAEIGCNQNQDINICMTSFINNNSCLSCLDENSLVTLADKTSKKIKDLHSGDIILSAYGHHAKIKDVIKKSWDSLVFFEINGNQIVITADHPVMTKEGWKAIDKNANQSNPIKRYGLNSVGSLKIGDTMITEQGETLINSLTARKAIKNGVSYNLLLEKPNQSFYANGILVKSHN